jgi:hypothetical protein
LGSAAALEILKKYMSSSETSGGSTGGGDFQSKMIGMAMSEAATLFDKTGHSGDKQDAVNGAAATMFKMLVQSKFSGGSEATSVTGGGNSGGLSQLLEMVCVSTLEKDCY